MTGEANIDAAILWFAGKTAVSIVTIAAIASFR
jgi:hypothetical protein